jgi:membrane-associated phospholipid phosphatase
MFIKINSIYDFISIFALFVNIYFIYSFDVIFIMGLAICLFFHDFAKELTTGWYAPIFKRPDGAINCSLFNSGGLVDHKSGFPSGHVTVISFFMNILRMRNGSSGDWKSIIIYNAPIVLMGYARIMKGCHNFIQVVAGYLLGYGVANLLYMYQDNIKLSVDKISLKFKNIFL